MAIIAGVKINDGDVVDLIADNSDATLSEIRLALSVAGLGSRFPLATVRHDQWIGVTALAGLTGPMAEVLATEIYDDYKWRFGAVDVQASELFDENSGA